MTELESLASRASQLAGKVDFWNSAVLWALLVTALAAGAIVFSQRLAFVRAKQLVDVQDRITKIKEANADNANLTLRRDLENETAKVAGLQKDASDAKAAQQRVETDLAKQQQRAADAEIELLRLQASLADRTISPQQQSLLASQMKPWAGLDIDVLIWGDTAEIQIISGKILKPLNDAGWGIHAGQAGGGGAVRGILVGVRPDADAHTVLAARQLVSSLQSFGLASELFGFNKMIGPSIEFNSSYTGRAPIRLFIGSKPSY